MKRQLAFSLVLATLSFIATKAIESFGVNEYYRFQATHFQKESGYFDLQHPASIQFLPTGLLPFSEISSLDSVHLLAMQPQGGNGLVLLNTDSSSFSVVKPLTSTINLASFVRVDSLLYLFDDNMGVYVSTFPFDSTSTKKITEVEPNWQSNSACFHPSTHRIYFNPEVVAHKKLAALSNEDVFNGFGGNVIVFDNSANFTRYIDSQDWNNSVLLLMSSGNFDGIDYNMLGDELIEKLG